MPSISCMLCEKECSCGCQFSKAAQAVLELSYFVADETLVTRKNYE
jgi:hypothetical protein